MEVGLTGARVQENLNETMAYLLIGAVGVFCLVVAGVEVRKRLRSRRLSKRHPVTAHTGIVPVPLDEAQSPVAVAPTDVEELFDDFDRRFEQLNARIEALADAPSAD